MFVFVGNFLFDWLDYGNWQTYQILEFLFSVVHQKLSIAYSALHIRCYVMLQLYSELRLLRLPEVAEGKIATSFFI